MIVVFAVVVLVIISAAVFLSHRSIVSRDPFDIGVPIVYSRQAISTQPISGARDVRPSERGELYYYNLVNYLRVIEVLKDGRVIAIARNNKRLCFLPSDAHFRKARLIERCIYRWRFPHL